MKRILLFSPGHAEVGGAARRARLYAQTLARRGWSVRVVTRAATLRRPRVERAPNLVVVEVPGFGRRRLGAALFLLCGLALGIPWAFRSRAILGIQIASQAVAAAICAAISRRPFLAFSTISGELLSDTSLAAGGRFGQVRRMLIGRAAFLVAQTSEAARELEAFISPDRIAVVPNPCESVHAPPLTGQPHAIFTGRLAQEKDLPRLLQAWRTVSQDRHGARLTIVGSGGAYRSAEVELREMVSQDDRLRRTVRFTGWIPDVGTELAAADVYVLPSRAEGMSNSLLEAATWGRVVVASDIVPNREALGEDYCLLFPVGNTEALADALARAFDDEDIKQRALQQIAARLARFDPDAIVAKVEHLIEAASVDRATG